MSDDAVIAKTRSPQLFYVVLAIIFSVFAWRLFSLQVLNYSEYNNLALSEHLKKFEIAPKRGDIYLRDGMNGASPIVLNEVRQTLFADPSGISEPVQTAEKLAIIMGVDETVYKELLSQDERAYVVLAKKLTEQQAEAVREADLAGVGLQDVPYRVYPEKSLAAQLLGFVNDEGVGQYGIEEAMQSELNGEPGLLRAITDVNGIPLSASNDNIEEPAVDGQDLVLTIDRSTQAAVEQLLEDGVKRAKAPSGSAIVMDPYSGAIVAMANYPSFEPANYTEVEDFARFSNKVVSNAYETGSGVKVFTMAAGLQEGVIAKDTRYFDAGFVQVDDRVIENAGTVGGADRTMLEVIQNSINTGVVYVLQQLGGGVIGESARTLLYEYFTESFGFGAVTGIAQPNEAAGTLIGPNATEGNSVRYANMAFGQGMTVTMLQMVSAFSSVVNGGDYYQPYLVASQGDRQNIPQIKKGGVISKQVSDDMLEMTRAVVDNGGGYSAQRPGYFIGGKTGTAQVLKDDGTYSDDREIGSFIGYTGGDRPEYVIMTRVNEPEVSGYAGSVAAAPIFADISNWLIDHHQFAPNN